VVAAGSLLGASAHVANVLPDIDDDLAHGIAGLPQRLGARRSRQLCAGLLGAAGVVLSLAPAPGPAGSGAGAGRPAAGPGRRLVRAGGLAIPAAALSVAARRAPEGSRSVFRLVLVAAALDVGLLLRRARR
jgi:4-hydroxybenzoate polyprenyltransferase